MGRRMREEARNAGLLGRMGEQSLANEHLNVEVMEGVGDGVEGLEREVYAHCEEDIQDEHVQHASLTQGSDAFNLGPLIE
ncbi:hypothetical protein L3X38_024940 [Prunus dulcis]|uniref:Uncharacterized protein n=1 Tax=Prunus dulcis TaxID=3755 RepID=A0AAD4Z5W2_PRUDU|nr:hypothetical protein L3X38_024940 [Prunus dulcis]